MTNEFKSDCLAIIKLAMETPETKAHIMAEWVAHCNFFSVRVFLGGWTPKADPDLSAECHDLDARKYAPAYHAEPSLVLAQIQALLA